MDKNGRRSRSLPILAAAEEPGLAAVDSPSTSSRHRFLVAVVVVVLAGHPLQPLAVVVHPLQPPAVVPAAVVGQLPQPLMPAPAALVVVDPLCGGSVVFDVQNGDG